MTTLASDADRIANQIADHAARLPRPAHRNLIAIAGPPAVGKSTVSECTLDALNARGCQAALVPMDGFHLDNAELEQRGLLHRKGAPETFDLTGFRSLIDDLSHKDTVSYPVFDRDLDRSIENAAQITADQTTVLVEGNYLLLDEPGWRDLSGFWALSVYLSAPVPVLEQRLTQRWLDHGLNHDQAVSRAHANDLPNAVRIEGNRLPADVVIA